MKILLTGHEGYLGSRLLAYFGDKGHAVVGFGRQQDITTITREVINEIRPDLVVNGATAANRIDTRYVVGGPDERVNVFGTRQLVTALQGTDIGLIHISTKDVYGEVYSSEQVRKYENRLIPNFTVNEGQPFRPQTIYAKTKLMGEFVAEGHPKTTIVRLSSGYTSQPHRRGNWILNFCRAAKAGESVRINGSGYQLRDPLHADDLGALILLIQEKGAWGLKMNAGGGIRSAYTILEVLDMIDPKLPREFVEGGDFGYVTDNTMAQDILGWGPTLSFPKELQTLIKKVNGE